MDGFDASKGVIIMAATNRPDVLDPALIRPGRFDRQVVVDPPDLRGREEILRVHARGVALDPSVDLRTIAARTPGFTGADLENVVNEAALLAARREKNSVTMEELEEAIDRATAGLERKSRVVSDKQKERVAVHEMGHALVALNCPEIDPLHRVTIIPRGAAALGITMTRPLEDRYVVTEPQLKDQMAFAMGGQAAEELYFDGVISTGAQNDLEKATDLARAMVSQFGMSDAVGPISLGRDDPNAWMPGATPKVSAHTSELIDKEVRRLLDEARLRADQILERNRGLLDRLSALLIATEVIDGDELKAYVEGKKEIPDPATIRPAPKPEPSADRVPAEPSVAARAVSMPPAPPMPATD
jgi:cell division protease FtsH